MENRIAADRVILHVAEVRGFVMKRFVAVLLSAAVLGAAGCAVIQRVVHIPVAGAVELPAKGDPGRTVDPALPAANNAFGFGLLKALPPSGNTLISPFSAESALAMTANGADAPTRKVMEKTLAIDAMGLAKANVAFADLLARLETDQPDSKLTIANSLWVAKDVNIPQSFLATNRDYYAAEATSVPFGTLEANQRIDAWVNARTHGLIPQLYGTQTPIDKDSVVVLVNALYFKADWKKQFDPAETRPQTFHGATDFDVPMMHLDEDGLGYLAEPGFDAVRLPYKDGKRAMYVFVPRTQGAVARNLGPQAALQDFLARLDGPTWEKWMKGFHEDKVVVALPKMTLKTMSDLKPALVSLGMGPAFQGGFDGLLGPNVHPMNPVAITDVRQAVTVEIDEKGTKAAAATGVTVGKTAAAVSAPAVIADHPFFFAIRDEASGAVLFAGVVRDPR